MSNLVIAGILGHRLLSKTEDIDREYGAVITSYLEDYYNNVNMLALVAESSATIRWALAQDSLGSTAAKKQALDAQKSLDAYLSSSPINRFVENLVIFNRSGVLISVTATTERLKAENVFESEIFLEYPGDGKAVAGIGPALNNKDRDILAYLYPLDTKQNSFIYIELDPEMIYSQLDPYRDSAHIIIETVDADRNICWYSSQEARTEHENGNYKKDYLINTTVFQPFHLKVSTLTKKNIYGQDDYYILQLVLVVAVTVICVGIVISRLISSRITKPLRRLSAHMVKLTDEEHLYIDEEIEKGNDEIAQIGKVFNRLVRHINRLMEKQKDMYEQKQKLEMKALQAQINPHFLYNTLDSIRWMAVIQKSNSIAKTVGALENLLRNMAKGIGNKITLKEELSLVQDYVSLQQVRYMEIFDYICDIPDEYLQCKIVKMTMQPVIENAIIHGIEPTGTYGEIRLTVGEDKGDLYISVEDNGAGMDEETLNALRAGTGSGNKNSLSGIGISNVDERIQMTYGPEYGLIFESVKGEFTRVTIHIPKEMEQEEEQYV